MTNRFKVVPIHMAGLDRWGVQDNDRGTVDIIGTKQEAEKELVALKLDPDTPRCARQRKEGKHNEEPEAF